MRPAAIEVHIDELVLRGMAPVDRAALAATLEAELARLLALPDGVDWKAAGGARPSIAAGAIGLIARPDILGARLAASLHGALQVLAGERVPR